MSATGWLAAAGSSLLLVASIIVVAGNWSSIDPIVRFSGLVASLLAVFFTAEAGRRVYPTTSTWLAVLAACLTAPVGVAAAATLGQPWSVCTLVGGAAALAAIELQWRRWDLVVLQAGSVIAFGLAAVGASALTGVPAPVVGAAGAAAALLAGSTRRAVAVAIAVGVCPFAVALAGAGVGEGTLTRLGMNGATVGWSGPLAGAIAALVVGVIAHRWANAPLAAGSLGVLGLGVIAGLAETDTGAWAWFALPAVTLFAAEVVGAASGDSPWRRLAGSTTRALGPTLAVGGLLAPLVTMVLRWDAPAAAVADLGWTVTLLWWSVALIALTVGTATRLGGNWRCVAAVAGAGAASAALAMAGAPMWTIAVVSAGAWVVITASTPWSSWDGSTCVLAFWVVFASVADDGRPLGWSLAVIIATVVAVTSCAVVGRCDGGLRVLVAAAIGSTAVMLAFDWEAIGWTEHVGEIGICLFVGLLGLASLVRPEPMSLPLGVGALVVASAATEPGGVDGLDVSMVVVLALAIAASARSTVSVRACVAAGLATVGGTMSLAAAGVEPTSVGLASTLGGIGLTGLAIVDRRLFPAHAAGLVAGALAVAISATTAPVLASITLAALGAQLAAFGMATVHRWAIVPGAALGAVATVSLWWTTGTDRWVLDAIAPYHADGGDLAVAVVSAVLLGAGAVVRRWAAASSWLAYGPGLGMAGTWLVATQLEPGTAWATLGALVVGVVAMALGGIRRLGAPLVLGSSIVGSTILVSAGPRLAAAPTWVWIATGGVGLLVVAVLLERSERPLVPDPRRDGQRSLLERFCEEFG